ncbi:MAG: putative oxidoreductase, aryl-alcohol dehydrogenase like protein [Edaphobacter sp.]|nr:putative oxidoreductase, aryl-alcohol dehydrogenase like protein [Edaphobacter sp.]
MNREVEQNDVLKTCEELGIGFVPWGPMGQGYLTVKIDAQTKFDPKMDVRSEFPRFSSENIAANMPIVDFLRQFSEKKNGTPAQISLGCSRKSRSLFRFPAHEVPITCTRI